MPVPRLLLFGSPGAGKSSLLGAASEKASGAFAGEVYELRADADPLKMPIQSADALIVALDVSLPGKELAAQFRQIAHWLKQLHEARGRRADIAELPVYFVLTKCDLLAKKDDTAGAWIKRIEEIKGRFDENFRKYLKNEGTGFGTIRLKLSAAAIQRPALADKPPSQEPFGVAELFRECGRSARDFQDRRNLSQSRLQNVIVGMIGLIAMLALSVVLLIEFQPPPRDASLEEKVRQVLPRPDATAAQRVQGTAKKLKDKEAKLLDIENADDFARLPSETRAAVTNYRAEIAEYLRLDQRSQTALKLPYLAKNDAEFKELDEAVQAFALPEAHAQDWADTRLGKRLQRIRNEYESLHAALNEEKSWLDAQIDVNRELLKSGTRLYGKLLNSEKDAAQEAKTWNQQYERQMNARPLTPREDNVPGVSLILYEDLGRFEPVKTAQKDWRISKDDLTNISALIQKKLKTG